MKLSKTQKLSFIMWLVILVIAVVYDILILEEPSGNDTLSWVMLFIMAKKMPFIFFALFFLMGHLSWKGNIKFINYFGNKRYIMIAVLGGSALIYNIIMMVTDISITRTAFIFFQEHPIANIFSVYLGHLLWGQVNNGNS